MSAADRLIRWSTAGAVVGVAAVVSYEYASNLVAAHGETGFTARLIAATLAANVAHGLGHGLIGAAVGAWPAVALVGSYVLMVIIRGAQTFSGVVSVSGNTCQADPLQQQAAQVFAADLAVDRIPSIRAIRAQLHVGQPRAQRVRSHLAALAAEVVDLPLR